MIWNLTVELSSTELHICYLIFCDECSLFSKFLLMMSQKIGLYAVFTVLITSYLTSYLIFFALQWYLGTSTARIYGPYIRPVYTARAYGPYIRVVCTGLKLEFHDADTDNLLGVTYHRAVFPVATELRSSKNYERWGPGKVWANSWGPRNSVPRRVPAHFNHCV